MLAYNLIKLFNYNMQWSCSLDRGSRYEGVLSRGGVAVCDCGGEGGGGVARTARTANSHNYNLLAKQSGASQLPDLPVSKRRPERK